MNPMDMRPEGIQKMMLTPKMLLSIHVLQLNIMNLKIFVRGELEYNPLLEEKEEVIAPADDETRIGEALTMLSDEKTEEEGFFLDSARYSKNEQKRDYFESLITEKESLYKHLHWQLEVLAESTQEKRIGEFIIGSLDENGFLQADLEEMREKIGADRENFKKALRLIRSFDPVGIGARDIKESLLIQLISSGKGDSSLYKIIYHHLEDLEKGHFKKISDALSIPVETIEKAKKRLSFFNPRPGANFNDPELNYTIEPDVLLNKNNGSYDVDVNEQGVPKLRVNSQYRNILKDKGASQGERDYVKKKVLNASWLIQALNQRRGTITRVCSYLVGAQKDFLDRGEVFTKPLTLKQVADELDVSEATISRVVFNKYAQTYSRIFPLKSFFAGKFKTNNGGVASNKSIKRKISQIISAEDAKSPLTDQEIVSMLNKDGIKISRRTVAKYRDSLKLPPFNLRKAK